MPRGVRPRPTEEGSQSPCLVWLVDCVAVLLVDAGTCGTSKDMIGRNALTGILIFVPGPFIRVLVANTSVANRARLYQVLRS